MSEDVRVDAQTKDTTMTDQTMTTISETTSRDLRNVPIRGSKATWSGQASVGARTDAHGWTWEVLLSGQGRDEQILLARTSGTATEILARGEDDLMLALQAYPWMAPLRPALAGWQQRRRASRLADEAARREERVAVERAAGERSMASATVEDWCEAEETLVVARTRGRERLTIPEIRGQRIVVRGPGGDRALHSRLGQTISGVVVGGVQYVDADTSYGYDADTWSRVQAHAEQARRLRRYAAEGPPPKPAGWRPCGYPGCHWTHCDECEGDGAYRGGAR